MFYADTNLEWEGLTMMEWWNRLSDARKIIMLLTGCFLCVVSIVGTLDKHGKDWHYPLEVADAIYQRGFEGLLWPERPIVPVRLTDKATNHMTCGSGCNTKGVR